MPKSFEYHQLTPVSSRTPLPVHTQSSWKTHKNAIARHACVSLAILLDLAVIGLVIIVKQRDILLPLPKNSLEKSLQSLLPTFGAIVGQFVVAVNALSIRQLVTAYAKKKISNRGMTFKEMNYLYILANKGIPFGFTVAASTAVVILLAQGFITTAIVNSVSPEIMNSGTTRTMPIIDLAFDTKQVNVACDYRGDLNGYGYGTNCPLNYGYGDIYNAYIDSLSNQFPVNGTRNGVSYPSSLLGISGSISKLSLRYARDSSGNNKRAVLPWDTLDACLPRVNVTATCASSLDNGQTPEFGSLSVTGNRGPGSVASFRIRNSDGTYVEGGDGYRYAPVYGSGAITIFQDDNSQTGETVVTILSTEKYAQNLTSPTIQCHVRASQSLVPIRIVGNTYVQLNPSLKCSTRPDPSPNSLLQVVRIAPMGLIKAQGQDGKLEAIANIPADMRQANGGTVQAIAVALERMASLGATEIYGILDGLTFPLNDTKAAIKWADTTDYTYATQRYRLGVSGKFSFFWALSPGTILFCVTWMWIWVGFRRGVDGGFNPLHPGCAAAAGMKREVLAADIATTKDADEDELEKLDVHVKYGYVNERRLGLEVPGGRPASSEHLQTPAYKGSRTSTPGLTEVPQLFYNDAGSTSQY